MGCHTAFALAQLLGQLLHILKLIKIGWNGMGFALAQGVELLGCLLASLCITR
jgi:hypothetical protein